MKYNEQFINKMVIIIYYQEDYNQQFFQTTFTIFTVKK